MKSTIPILLFFALPFVIYGGDPYIYMPEEVKNIKCILAERGTEINGELLVNEDSFYGGDGYGFLFEGTIKEDLRAVIIKFVTNENIKTCEREMAMYSYLKAYKNASVEKYGIPVVYYYGRWENYTLMAYTKLMEDDLSDIAEEVSSFRDLDILILLRDFVYQSKYMHGHGVRHDNINPNTIMFRGHRSFLTGFKYSSKMMEDNLCIGSDDFDCKRYITGKNRRAIDDYESFLYTISTATKRDWFKERYNDNERRKNALRNEGLQKVIKAFASEVFTNDASKQFPDYNKLEKVVSDEMKQITRNGAPKFSWIKTKAEMSPARNIRHITEPNSFNFTVFPYPPIVLPQAQNTNKMILGSSSK